jgi:hypothetical protein
MGLLLVLKMSHFKTKRVGPKWQSFAPYARCGVEYYRSRGVSMITTPGRGAGPEQWVELNEGMSTIRLNCTFNHLPFGTLQY